LGRYDIVALIGIGGMGEVYRAHNAELWRAVQNAASTLGSTNRLLNHFYYHFVR
jgi:serine/threonine protein kinase